MDSAEMYDPGAHEDILGPARKNIEKVRKRDVALRLIDREGKPLVGKTVEVAQKKHAFCFGDQLWGLDRAFREGQAEQDRWRYYKRHFAELLNSATALCYWTERPKNDGPKTEDLQGEPQYDGFHYCLNWAMSEGLTVKGHPLFWSINKCVPDWVKRYDYDTQMKFAEVRVRTLVAGARGRVKIWDIVNEALWEPTFRNLPKRNWPHIEPPEPISEYICEVLRWARDEDPDAVYIVNDYGLTGGKKTAPQTDEGTKVTPAFQRKRFLDLLDAMADRGALPDAVGLQSHTGGWTDHAHQWEAYDDVAPGGLPIHITEFWAHTRHLEEAGMPREEIDRLQAEYVANFLTAAFGHPAVDAFFFWGIMGHAVRFSGKGSSHEKTPLYHRIYDLLHREWNTRQCLTTDDQGVVTFRGFFGDYALRQTLLSGQTTGTPFTVSAGQEGVQTLRIDPRA
jgi:endo-1,4-beta-xylanase